MSFLIDVVLHVRDEDEAADYDDEAYFDVSFKLGDAF